MLHHFHDKLWNYVQWQKEGLHWPQSGNTRMELTLSFFISFSLFLSIFSLSLTLSLSLSRKPWQTKLNRWITNLKWAHCIWGAKLPLRTNYCLLSHSFVCFSSEQLREAVIHCFKKGGKKVSVCHPDTKRLKKKEHSELQLPTFLHSFFLITIFALYFPIFIISLLFLSISLSLSHSLFHMFT